MSKFIGVVHHNDLEGGFWELACDDGSTYSLANADRGMKKEGLRVEVEGEVDEDAMGASMSGPKLVVRSFRVRK